MRQLLIGNCTIAVPSQGLATRMPDLIERTPETASVASSGSPPARWRLPTRIAFRLCAIYFVLYVLSTQMLGSLFSLPNLASGPPLSLMVTWVARRIFHFATPLVIFSGSGDKPFDFALAATLLAIAIGVTVIWSVIDRARPTYERLHGWVHLFVRLAVGATMISYGMAKVIPLQMPFPSLTRLVEPYGQFSLMGVLWSQIGSSPAFERFTGSVELIAGILLFIPRLSLLGSLVALLAASFIFVLNMTYDVPVKLFSLHLVLMSLFLLTPHGSHLLNVFVLNRATEPRRTPVLIHHVIGRRAIAAAQVVLGLWLLVANFNQSTQAAARFGSTAEAPPLYGIWDVVAMTIDQQVRPPLTTDDQRWRRVIVSAATSVSFQRMDDTFETFRATIDTAAKSITLSTGGNITGAVARLAFEQPSADQLVIEGPIDGKKIRMELHRVDHTAFRLLQSRFRWIQDYPYNR